MPYFISALGDQALTIHLGNAIDESTNQQCHSLANYISQAHIVGVKDIIPAYNTVSILYDAMQVQKNGHVNSPSILLQKQLNALIEDFKADVGFRARNVVLPACFHASLAADLEMMAAHSGKPADEAIQQFIQTNYRVYMLGFLPGFAYMGKVDDELAMPRKEKPHLNIPAGSIGIAGNQAGIYPLNSPGGWNIIGRTPLQMFNVEMDEPCLLKPGDNVTFKVIDIDAFHRLNQNL